MKLCPHCQTVFSDDEFFCTSDGTPLLENYRKLEEKPNPTALYPQFDNNPPPNSFNPPPPTVQIGQPNIHSLGETVTQPSFIPPVQSPTPATNSNKNVIIAVLATASVFLLIGMIFLGVNNYLISKETENKPVSNSNTREDNSGTNNNNSSEDNTSNSKNDKQDNIVDKDKKRDEESDKSTPKSNDLNQILPNNTGRQYYGKSHFPKRTLNLILSFTRNGQNLYGSAETDIDYDDLTGLIKSDGSFSVKGISRNTGEVTGTWRGKITTNGQVSGYWTSTGGGSPVRFSAQH